MYNEKMSSRGRDRALPRRAKPVGNRSQPRLGTPAGAPRPRLGK